MEMHDQILGGEPLRYVPTYLGYGKDPEGKSSALGFDTIWAYELMWNPMKNLGQGNSICLYYYNLAYSQPLYLHIDLRTDNANAVMFWWNASTCRYLGIAARTPMRRFATGRKRPSRITSASSPTSRPEFSTASTKRPTCTGTRPPRPR